MSWPSNHSLIIRATAHEGVIFPSAPYMYVEEYSTAPSSVHSWRSLIISAPSLYSSSATASLNARIISRVAALPIKSRASLNAICVVYALRMQPQKVPHFSFGTTGPVYTASFFFTSP